MKFSSALLSSVALCLFSSVVTAARDVPINGELEARQNNRFGGNNGGQNRNGNNGGGKGGNAGGAASTTSAAAAATSSAVANVNKNTGGSGGNSNNGSGNPQTSLSESCVLSLHGALSYLPIKLSTRALSTPILLRMARRVRRRQVRFLA